MAKTVFEGDHRHLVDVLTRARAASGLTQTELAERVGKDQTFVSIIERGQRRVDVLEFIVLARAMGHDPVDLFRQVHEKVSPTLRI